MLQKLKDFVLLLKQDKRSQIFTAIGVLLLVGLFTCQPSNVRVAKKGQGKQELSTGVTAQSEVVPDLVRALKGDVDQLKSVTKDQNAKIDAQQGEMKEYVQRNAEIFRKMIDRIGESESAISQMSTGQIAGGAGGVSPEIYTGEAGSNGNMVMGPDGVMRVSGAPGIEEFSASQNPLVAPPISPNAPQKIAVVGAGDSVRVKLLAGINAPTDGTPYPVVLKMIGDVHGPDGSVLPLGEARVVAAAQGSLTDSRALFRLTSLNLRYPDGRRNVIDVDGWIVGEDGLRGMEGILIDPIGKAIAAGALSGGLEGLGQGFAARNTTVTTNVLGGQTSTITGSEMDYAKGRALQGASQVYSRLIENRVNRLVPQVQVLSNREGTAVFAKSFKIPGLIEALEEGDDTYNNLD